MENKLWKKGIVLGIIMLFFGAGITPNVLVRNVKADTITTTIQPSSSDSYASIYDVTENYGDEVLMDVGSSVQHGSSSNSYVKFDLSTIPSGILIESAYLELYCYAIGTSEYVNVYEVLDNWDESTLTWNNQPDFYMSPSISTFVNSPEWHSWDVTDHVNNWYNNVHPNYGFVLLRDDMSPHISSYVTKEGWDYWKPKLEITYTTDIPDLYISTGNPTVTPTYIPAGDYITVSDWTVKNQGTDSCGTFDYGYYLSTDSNIDDAEDFWLYGNTISGLNIGEEYDISSVMLTIPSSTPSGYYYIGILVDRFNEILEINKVNNYVSSSITVENINSEPSKPDTPEGRTDITYPYSLFYHTSGSDPDGDQITFGWDYDGDYIVDSWDTNWYNSGDDAKWLKTWDVGGEYVIRVISMDEHSETGPFSDPLYVTVNNPPKLMDGKVSPTHGLSSDLYTYEVTYQDDDGDIPSKKNVIINGNSHEMEYIGGDYETGAIYRLEKYFSDEDQSESRFGALSNKFYFEFENEYDAVRFPEENYIRDPDIILIELLIGEIAGVALKAMAVTWSAISMAVLSAAALMLMVLVLPVGLFQGFLDAFPNSEYMYGLGVACPVNVTITDQFGRIMSDNGSVNIPGACFLKYENVTLFFLPKNITCNVNITSYDTGDLHILKTSPLDNYNYSVIGEEDILLSENTHIEFVSNFSSDSLNFSIDYDGDGIVDAELESTFDEVFFTDYPTAFFLYYPGQIIQNVPIEFNASFSSYTINPDTTFMWDFGDGENGIGRVTNHTYYQCGTYEVLLNLTDYRGLSSLFKRTITVNDIIAPNTNIQLSQPKCGYLDRWVTSDSIFNLTANDNSGGLGVNKTYYRIWFNEIWTPWIEYVDNFTLPTEGKYYLEFYSTDNAGNIENIIHRTHYVDNSPPESFLTYWGPHYTDGANHWIKTYTPLKVMAWDYPDYASGLDTAYYKVSKWDGDEWQLEVDWTPYYFGNLSIYIPSECKHKFEYYSVDWLGNTESIKHEILNVDESPPTTTLSFGMPYYNDGENFWTISSTSISFISIDQPDCACGVESTYYRIDGNSWTEYSGQFTISGEGEHQVEFYSIDFFGYMENINSQTIIIDDDPPEIINISLPVDPIKYNNTITLNASFIDELFTGFHTASIECGDGNITVGNVNESEKTINASWSYDQPGVYTVNLTIEDYLGRTDWMIFQYVVIYNPEEGFVTGGGLIDSPEGAYAPDPTLTGKANFGFVSKYKKGQQTPTGKTRFQFKVADMNFHSDSYDWLVVAGHKAMYKGNGTINGTGNYGFMISAIDEKLTPSTDVDMFRIKIWDKDNNDEVIYDNQLGDDEDEDPTTEIAGGQIVIHKS